MKSLGVLFGLGCVLAFVAACQNEQQSRPLSDYADQSGERVRILSRQAGDDAALKTPGVWLITSDAELLKTGASSLAQVPVDFANQSLVVVALGERPTGGYWARITNLQRKGHTLYVQGQANQPGDNDVTTQVISYPYEAVIIERQQGVTRVLSEIESLTGAENRDPYLVAPRQMDTPNPHTATAPVTTEPAAP
jgi:hypothetical protein